MVVPSSEELCEALADLRLIDETFDPSVLDQPIRPSIFSSLAGTLAEELNPHAFFYDPDQLPSAFDAKLCDFLTALDCPTAPAALAGPEERRAVLDFLAAEVQAQRLRTRLRAKSLHHDAADLHVAAALSELSAALGVSPDESAAVRTLAQLRTFLAALAARARRELAARPLPPLLLPAGCRAPSDAQRARLAALNAALGAEYKLRRGLLLKRLHVTVQAFLYSPRATAAPRTAEDFRRRLRALTRADAQRERAPIALVDALASRAPVLAQQIGAERPPPPAPPNRLKSVVIGSVPDRGGRVGRGAESMPQFRVREMGGEGRRWRGDNERRGKGKKKGKKKKR